MSQTDQNVANGSGSAVRADLNAHLDAIATNHSGATEPTTKFANQWWADTSANILKRRNNANTTWISAMSLTTGLLIGTDVQAYDANNAVTDAAQSFTKAQRGTPIALTSSAASIAVDASLGNNFSHTFTENTTLANPTNLVAGQSGSIALTQHASAPKTLAFGSYWKFAGGTAPSVTATNSAKDRIDYYVKSTTEIDAVLTADNQ